MKSMVNLVLKPCDLIPSLPKMLINLTLKTHNLHFGLLQTVINVNPPIPWINFLPPPHFWIKSGRLAVLRIWWIKGEQLILGQKN